MAHPDLNAIYDKMYEFAKGLLKSNSTFCPFGMSMTRDGKVEAFGGWTGEENQKAEEVIELIIGGLKAFANKKAIRAAGVCIDTRVTPPGKKDKIDAILTQVEHENGEVLDVFIPYKKGFLGRMKYDQPFVVRGKPRFFNQQRQAEQSAQPDSQ